MYGKNIWILLEWFIDWSPTFPSMTAMKIKSTTLVVAESQEPMSLSSSSVWDVILEKYISINVLTSICK